MAIERCLNLAIIGLGNQAREHLDAALNLDQVRIVAGVDLQVNDSAFREALAAQYRGLILFDALEQLLQQKETLGLQGLILALPHHVYSRCWDDLLKFGLPLLKEKPLGRDFAEAHDLVGRARAAGCPLQTAIQRRRHDSYDFLYRYLMSHQLTVHEVHAHLHLGKGNPPGSQVTSTGGWRSNRQNSGGGILLDAGYHLIDLVMHLVGPFDVVSSTLISEGHLEIGQGIEERAWVLGRNEHAWIMIDTWLRGNPSDSGPSAYQKSEGICLQTSGGVLYANRSQVRLEQSVLCESDVAWKHAMQSQLYDFANNILAHHWEDLHFWDQLPAMRVVDEAYRLATLH